MRFGPSEVPLETAAVEKPTALLLEPKLIHRWNIKTMMAQATALNISI